MLPTKQPADNYQASGTLAKNTTISTMNNDDSIRNYNTETIPVKSMRQYNTIKENLETKYNIQFSKNGELLGLFDNSGQIKIFDIKKNKLIQSFYRPGNITDVDFSMDNQYIVVGFTPNDRKCFFNIWDLLSGEQVVSQEFSALQNKVFLQKIQFLEESKFLFIWLLHTGCCGFANTELYLYDLKTGKKFSNLRGAIPELSNSGVYDYFFTDKSYQLHILSANGWYVCWDFIKEQKINSIKTTNKRYFEKIFNYLNKYKLLCIFDGKNITLTNIETKHVQYFDFFPSEIMQLWIINESELLIELKDSIYKADLINKTLKKVLYREEYDVFAFNPISESIAIIYEDTLRISNIYDIQNSIELYRIKTTNHLVNDLMMNNVNELLIKTENQFYKINVSHFRLPERMQLTHIDKSEFLSAFLQNDIEASILQLNIKIIDNYSEFEMRVEFKLGDKTISIPVEYSNNDPEIYYTHDKKYMIIKTAHTGAVLPYYGYTIIDMLNDQRFSAIPTGNKEINYTLYYNMKKELIIFISDSIIKFQEAVICILKI